MLIQQVLLGLFALSVLAIGLVVMLRLLWAACQATLASQIPYYAVAYALWRMAARFQASLRDPEVPPGAEGTSEPRPGRVASNDARGST